MYKECRYRASGDRGIIIEVGNEISKEINRKVRGLVYCIENNKMQEIVELIPTYKSILLTYDPLKISYNDLVERLKGIENTMNEVKLPPQEVIRVPTLYGGEYGVDIDYVAQHNGLTVDEVIQIHSGIDYLVYMLGFTPGFPYLGGMSEKIETPRLEVPREKISSGAVGIAGNQTGIYPIDSPGGWQLIGKTPVKLFDLNREPAVLLSSGQYIRFESIDLDTYREISEEVEKGVYKVKKSLLKECGLDE